MATASPGFKLIFFHGTMKLTRKAVPTSPTETAKAALRPSMYDRMTPGSSSAEKTERRSEAPVARTSSGETPGALVVKE